MTMRSIRRVIIIGTTRRGKRRTWKRESAVYATAAVSWPVGLSGVTLPTPGMEKMANVEAVTTRGSAVKTKPIAPLMSMFSLTARSSSLRFSSSFP